MITKENAIPGTEVMYGDHQTVIEPGSYDDPELGFMLKTARFPGGYPAKEFKFLNDIEKTDVQNNLTPVLFETIILDEKEPVKITAALIRQKSKPLTDLVIENIFDQDGYDKVKQAKNKAVKTRTSIEKLEKALNSQLKAEFDGKKKEVTTYTAELYEACREVENTLQAKLTAIDDAKDTEVKRLAEEKREKTEAREQKMFELGMTWNGQVFIGHNTSFNKDFLFRLNAEKYENLVTNIEGIRMESSITGEEPAAAPAPVTQQSKPFVSNGTTTVERADRVYDNTVFEKKIPGTTFRIILTKGQVADPDADALIINERVMESAIYVQIVK